MIWLQFLTKFFKILRDGQTPAQIAGGFALGSIVGLSPGLTLQGLFIWLLIFILDVNLSSAFLSFSICALLAYLLDPVFHWFGYLVLTDIPSLKGFWTMLYNAPVAPLSRFYNTVVMGSFLTAIVLAFPIYFGMKKFVVGYRKTFHNTVEKWKIYQVISKSFVVQWYLKIRDLGVL